MLIIIESKNKTDTQIDDYDYQAKKNISSF